MVVLGAPVDGSYEDAAIEISESSTENQCRIETRSQGARGGVEQQAAEVMKFVRRGFQQHAVGGPIVDVGLAGIEPVIARQAQQVQAGGHAKGEALREIEGLCGVDSKNSIYSAGGGDMNVLV